MKKINLSCPHEAKSRIFLPAQPGLWVYCHCVYPGAGTDSCSAGYRRQHPAAARQLEYTPEKVVWLGLIGLAAVVDFLDGFIARMFKATSELGKQLDSPADVVSFAWRLP